MNYFFCGNPLNCRRTYGSVLNMRSLDRVSIAQVGKWKEAWYRGFK